MQKAILDLPKQFEWEPEIVNADKLGRYDQFIVAGMGGSHLAANILRGWNSFLKVIIHSNYDLPAISKKELQKSLLILSSYSGNTEEVLDVFSQAQKKNITTAVVSKGGALIKEAQKHKIPYIQIPDTGIQPRLALGFSLKALLKLMKQDEALKHLFELSVLLNPGAFEAPGRKLAEKLKNYIPIIYSSQKNSALALNWKIKFNETAKIPSFYNTFPEMNHSEITGFDFQKTTKHLSQNFYFILLRDTTDHPRILKRMEILEKLYLNKGLPIEIINLADKDFFEKVFSSLLLADWASYYIACKYGVEPEQTTLIEKFKEAVNPSS